jgi:hypothetical protein
MATRTPGVVPTITRIATAVKTVLAAPVQTLATSLPTNKESTSKESAVETNIRGSIVNTQAPSSDAIKTVYASSTPVKMVSNTIATNTSEAISPDVVVTKTPATTVKPGLTVIKAPPLRVKPGKTDGSMLIPADPMPLPKAAFDYKTAGLIALAAVVVLGGMVMWSGQSKGKTQAVAMNARRRGISDAERELWIINDEGFYRWRKATGLSKRDFIRQYRSDIDAAIRSKPGMSRYGLSDSESSGRGRRGIIGE